MTIEIENFINISLQGVPQGLSNVNVNSLALFTTEIPSNIDTYRTYKSAKAVGDDYGTSSVAYQMATAIFSQTPNILSGNGRLVTIPMQAAVSATQGDWVSDDISANLAGIEAVSDGDITVTLNGTDIDLIDLNFDGASSLSDVATILQRKLTDVIVTASSTALTFTSKKVGSSSAVVVKALSGGAGTDLSGASFFDTASGTATSGGNAQGETIIEAIARTEEEVSYVGMITDLEMEDAVVKTLATAVQAKKKMFIHHFTSTEDLEPTTGICSQIKDASETKSRCLYYSVSPAAANLMKAAYAGRAFSVNFAGSNTTQTMNLKALATITPDAIITQTIYDKAKVAGADIYGDVSSLPIVVSFGGNDFFDNVYNSQWLQFALEVAGFNYLKQTNTKNPQTEEGMNGLKGAYAKVLDQGVTNQAIGTGLTWNSAETFGNPEDLKRNVTDFGYYQYSLPIAQQAQPDREDRKAPLVQIAVKFAGAIHSSSVIVTIEK